MSRPPCELLPWDSNFFHLRVARVLSTTLDASDLEEIEGWCRTAEIDCVYYLADSRTEEEHRWRTTRGFMFVDSRVTLEAPVPPATGLQSGIRPARESDITALSDIAATGHLSTRFYADSRFAPAASRLYRFWIEQSVRDASTTVLVPDTSPVSAYITCYELSRGIGQIGLVGVASSARGKGLGGELVQAALRCFADRSCSVARVVTQARNEPAMRLYRAGGFRRVRTQWWYHRWLTTGTAQ